MDRGDYVSQRGMFVGPFNYYTLNGYLKFYSDVFGEKEHGKGAISPSFCLVTLKTNLTFNFFSNEPSPSL